jgi:ketosteroid isomerase-like protein
VAADNQPVSRADVDFILDHFEATNQRDFGRAMDMYADDVVLVVGKHFLSGGTFEGKQAVGEWFGDWFRTFGFDHHFNIVESRDLGNGVVFLFVAIEGSGRASGAKAHMQGGYLYRVVEQQIARVQLFATREEALEGASLPEWSGPETD